MFKIIQKLVILLTSLCLTACPEKTPVPPVITLKAIDCPKDQIAINAASTFTPDSSGQGGMVTVTVTVTCNGSSIRNFEVEITIPGWTGVSAGKFTSDSTGTLKKQFKLGSDQKGNKVKVRVTGSDGDKETEVTIT